MKTDIVQNSSILNSIKTTIEEARNKAKQSINHIMTEAYWQIGRLIVEEQRGKERATYSEGLIKELSQRLSEEYGKGFSQKKLTKYEKFLSCYSNFADTVCQIELESLSTYLNIEDDSKREC